MDETERTALPRGDGERAARAHAYLFLVLEGGRPAAGGMRVALDGVDSVTLGRADDRSVAKRGRTRAVGVPDPRMSAAHARLLNEGGAWRVEDTGSTNGTTVNGTAVTAAEIRPGDVVGVGQTLFTIAKVPHDGPSAGDLDTSDRRVQSASTGLRTLDPALARRFDRLARVASTPISVLLLGETGSGKEVLARAVHELSKRPGPFVAVNCGAIPHGLVESHLFGHVKGAFSGAVREEPGLVRAAHFGTLLLDEIGDLPASSQAALLRVLQEGEVLPVGSSTPVKVDVRVIGATHKPLEALVERGDFRKDLYARLAGYAFELPALRARKVDLGLLVAALTTKIPAVATLRLHREAARALFAYDWPMNVRELEQALRAASALAEQGILGVEDLPGPVAGSLDAEGDEAEEEGASADDEELRRDLLVRLADAKGNVSEVARAMGKARQQVQRWVRRFGIDAEAFRERER